MFKPSLIFILTLLPLAVIAQETSESAIPHHLHTDGETIFWAKPGLEPFYFPAGRRDGQVGFGDLMVEDLMKLLPGYQHQELRANYSRMIAEIRSGNPVCGIIHRTPEREQFTAYSNILAFPPSYRLYILAEKRHDYKQLPGWEDGAVSLEDVLQSKRRLRMGHQVKHSYGNALDETLARHSRNLEQIRGYSGQKSLVKMLLADRVDFILEFSWVVNYHLRELNLDVSELEGVVLTEAPAYLPVSIGCPNNIWGQHLIEHLNNITPPLHERMKGYLEAWLEPEEIEDYRTAFKHYFYPELIH